MAETVNEGKWNRKKIREMMASKALWTALKELGFYFK